MNLLVIIGFISLSQQSDLYFSFFYSVSTVQCFKSCKYTKYKKTKTKTKTNGLCATGLEFQEKGKEPRCV